MFYARQSRRNNILFPLKSLHFSGIQTRSVTTSTESFSLLNLCRNPHHLQQIHARYILHGLHQNLALSSNDLLCNTMMKNLYKFGNYGETLYVYRQMVLQSIYPDERSYPFVIKSCTCLADVVNGEKINAKVVKLGFDSFDDVADAMIELHIRIGRGFENNKGVTPRKFNDLKNDPNDSNCEAVQKGKFEKSFGLFELMSIEGAELDPDTMINLLRSAVDLKSVALGRIVHCVAVVNDLCRDLSVNTALLSMYSKLASLEDARKLFEKMHEKDCVKWNIMISAYSRSGRWKESAELLMCMGRSGVRADIFTAIAAVPSIGRMKNIEWGKQMHANVMRNGSDYQISVHNSLIDMYCECEHLNNARKIFVSVKNKTVITWSSMIKGFVTHDHYLEALELFCKMKQDGAEVDFVIIINVLPACVNIGGLEYVKYIHCCSEKLGLNLLSSVNTAIFIGYAKCGCIEMAGKLFDEEKIDSKDIITWNSMISAYAKHGDWSQCFKLYTQMTKSNLRADLITFLGLLTACVNAGLVQEGREIFKEMKESYGYEPSQEHYASMVNLLGRAGHMDEARELVTSMPFKPDARVWGPLLSACKMHSDTALGKLTAEKLISMEPENAGNYVLLSNIYAAAGKWDEVAKMRTFLRDRGLKKTPGCSWIEIGKLVHEFRVADQSHSQSPDIYTILGILELEIMEERRVPKN